MDFFYYIRKGIYQSDSVCGKEHVKYFWKIHFDASMIYQTMLLGHTHKVKIIKNDELCGSYF